MKKLFLTLFIFSFASINSMNRARRVVQSAARSSNLLLKNNSLSLGHKAYIKSVNSNVSDNIFLRKKF